MSDTIEVEVTKEALTYPQRAQAIAKIQNAQDYEQAGKLLVTIKGMRKRILDVFGPIVKAAHEAHKIARGKQTEAEAPLDLAEGHLKRLIGDYNAEQDRIRQQQQREAEAAARRAEEERILAEAKAAEDAGDNEAAQAIIEQPVVAPVVIVQTAAPKLEGVSFRENWTFQITDETKIPREFLVVDAKKIGQVVKAMKGMTNIPGVRAYAEKVVSGRAA